MVLRFFIHAMAIAFLFMSCADGERDNPYDPGSNNYWGWGSSSASTKNYCVYAELGQCYFGIYSACPGVGGKLADACPYSSSSSNAAVSSSGQSNQSSSSSALQYSYCVFVSERMCLTGPLSECPPGGTLSNSCPYGSSSSAAVAKLSSSSSKPSSSSSVPSSSSVAPSSSSAAPSSSSAVVSSSSSKPSSSSSAPPSSSSAAPSSSSSAPPSSSSSAPPQSGVTYGPSVTYGGETYQTVVIGTQTWFKRNLNYNADGSKCYNNNASNCNTYGRLYNWATAMALDASCNSTTCASQITVPNHRGICPSGWHIPSGADWNVLMKFVNPSCSDNSYCEGAGTKLKATSGWNSYSGIPAGTDTYGFSALPGGYFGDWFYDVDYYGYWWSSYEYNSDDAYYRYIYFNHDGVGYYNRNKSNLYSVRCVED